MKKLSTISSIIAIIFALAFLPQYISYATSLFQQPETAWVVWETGSPVQRLARDAGSVWSGMYQGGLGQWQLPAGQVKSLGTADGLSGDHVLSVAVDAGGRKWSAALDGGVNRIDGSAITDLTPGGAAGHNPWDLYTDGDQVWLGSLGGGVSHYVDGAWTTYNTDNSSLPDDDVYAVAVDHTGRAWAGTIGYGIASLENGNWVPQTLPVQVADPLTPGASRTNQAVADIAVDAAGNKWFATDGSGVAVLDASNTNWTIYNTGNSGLGSDFVQRVYIDAQGNTWFGTLGGGVNRLSADQTQWQAYNTANSSLPEDDILDLAVDEQGGLWLAAYDAGLAYYGPLPATPPAFDFDLFNQPAYNPGKVKGYYLWVDPATYEWTLAWSGDGQPHTFSGEIRMDSPITLLQQIGLEGTDSVTSSGNTLLISAGEQSGEDKITFKPGLSASEFTVRLMIDGAYYPYNIHLGKAGQAPGTAPFRMAAVQPIAPQTSLQASQTIDEGDEIFLFTEISDPDSPLGHTIHWDFGDGTLLEDTQSVSHVYQNDGTYNLQLLVTDVHGMSSTKTMTVTVQNVAPLVSSYYVPLIPSLNRPVSFAYDMADPGQLDPHLVTWDFGDGSGPVTAQGTSVEHTYQQLGTYTATLTITDDDTQTVQTLDVIVSNEAPEFSLGENIVLNMGEQLSRVISFTDSSSADWDLSISYGDGSAPEESSLSNVQHFALNHIYPESGVFTIEVSLTDHADATTTGTLQVTVTNNTPTPTLTPTLAPSETPTETMTPTETPTPDETETALPTETASETPVPAVTDTPSPIATDVLTPVPTDTPTTAATDTLTPAVTNTPTLTSVYTPTPTLTRTSTPTQTQTSSYPATIAGLRALLRSLHEQEQVETPLYRALELSLAIAQRQLNQGHEQAVISILRAFIVVVRAQAGEHLTPAASQQLADLAARVILAIRDNDPTSTPAPTATFTPRPTSTPTATRTRTATSSPTPANLYLHASGSGTSNPSTLFLASAPPTGTSPRYKDSAGVKFHNGNHWKEVGIWTAAASQISGQLKTLGNLNVWLGLKDSDDQGTRFDLRVEVYRNGVLVTSGETRCIQNITRNPDSAREVSVAFGTFSPVTMNGTSDKLSLKVLTRIGTNASGTQCGGHNNADGLRLYFDSATRPAKFGYQ